MRIPTLVLVALLAAGCTSPTIQRKSSDTSTTDTTVSTPTTPMAADAGEGITAPSTIEQTTGSTSTTTTTTQSNPAKPDRLRTGSVREMVEYYPPVGTGTYAK